MVSEHTHESLKGGQYIRAEAGIRWKGKGRSVPSRPERGHLYSRRFVHNPRSSSTLSIRSANRFPFSQQTPNHILSISRSIPSLVELRAHGFSEASVTSKRVIGRVEWSRTVRGDSST